MSMPKSKSMKKELTVIIPCHNEEVTITKLILKIKKSYPGIRILVIDNSSSDQTASFARKAGAEVVNEIRKGKGYAVRAGFLSSKTRFVVLIDGDLTYEIQDISTIYTHLQQGYDMSVANRIPQTPEAYRLGHSMGNQLLSWFQQKFLGVEVQDTLSGFRGFSKEFIPMYIDKPKAFEIEASLNIYSNVIGAKICNFDSAYYGRPQESSSKLSTWKDGLKISKLIVKLIFKYKPIIPFSIASGILFSIGIILFYNPLKDYTEIGKVLHFPSLIVASSSLVLALLNLIYGLIAQRMLNIHTDESKRIFRLMKLS